MDGIRQKVSLCFSNVFPDVPQDALATASNSSLAAWDSIAHVTLLTSVAEEFGIDLEAEDYESLVSVPLIVEYLETKLS